MIDHPRSGPTAQTFMGHLSLGRQSFANALGCRARRIALVLGALTLAASTLHAQAVRESAAYTVHGTVFDSIGLAVLPGAVVQLARIAGADSAPQVRTVVADGAGRYRFSGLPAGRYAVGFQHELLDVLAIEAPLRAFELARDSVVVVDLATESGGVVRNLRCGADSAGGDGMLAGLVLDGAQGAPAPGAKVTLRWLETSFQRRGIRSTPKQFTAVAGDDGRYLACGVPSGAEIQVVATSAGRRSIDGSVTIPAGGALRQDFVLADSGVSKGNAIVTGVAVRSDSGVVETGIASIDALGIEAPIRNGTFSLTGIPAGTWSLGLRSIGYEPRTLLVTAPVSSVAPLRVILEKKPQVLEVVNVIGKASAEVKLLNSIVERSRTSTGSVFLPGNQWLEYAIYPADVLRAAPGFHYQDPFHATGRLGCRNIAVFLDGFRYPDLESVTNAAPMKTILAIEAYPDIATAPMVLRTAAPHDQCALIAVWTKR